MPPNVAPTAAILLLPAMNEPCNNGTIISNLLSKVLFKWTPATNADSYKLTVKNMLTGQTSEANLTVAQAEVIISRNTPYSWFVTSNSSKSTEVAVSNVWKFYNTGNGVENYAPFPAEISYPLQGVTLINVNGKVILKWVGTDVDNDIRNYDIYFGAISDPPLLKQNYNDDSYEVPVDSYKLYYWKIVTKDQKGNTSNSGIYQFMMH